MTCTTPLPERLDPPDAASECAVCKRETHDGRDLDLCDEAVGTLHSAALVRLSARIPTGKQFVCETCLDDLHDAQERHRAEAFDTISDALGLDDCEHPALRAREVVQRLQSSPAPVGVEVRDWLTTSDVIEAFGSWEDSKPWAYIADDLNRIVASRLSSIKPGEVVVSQSYYIAALENAANQFCAACIMVGTEDCPRGLHACGKGCSIWRLDAPRINALRAQATTTEKESRR